MHVTQCLLQETLASRWENTSKPFIANKVCNIHYRSSYIVVGEIEDDVEYVVDKVEILGGLRYQFNLCHRFPLCILYMNICISVGC